MSIFNRKGTDDKEKSAKNKPVKLTKEEQAKLDKWKKRFEEAKIRYSSNLTEMKDQEAVFYGDRRVKRDHNRGGGYSKKVSSNVRNIVYELIECEVDSSIPMPKVTPIHENDEELAKIIEQALLNEIRLLRMQKLNDIDERVTYIQGGDFFHIEWDHTKGFHCNIGNVAVSERHPRTVIPQPGVTEIDEMDYLFIMTPQTKEYVKRKYQVDVSDTTDTENELREAEGRSLEEDVITVIRCYYRNNENKIGLFSWVGEHILEDFEDYQARRLLRCTKCGRIKVGDTCECGSKSFEEKAEDYEEITEDIITLDGTRIPATTQENVPEIDEEGNPIIGENGLPIENMVEKQVKIPYYKPNEIPIVLRRNVSKAGSFLGASDVAVIADQQDAIKKLGNKMQEKLLKGGSIVTLPKTAKIQTTDEELKVVRVNSPNEAALIEVKNIQADISMDRIMLETNYDWAKSTLGITDSFQGKYDSSATSGTAKQYSINQAAGRMESKRVLKNEAYADLYRLIFKHLLAYADQPIPLSGKDEEGNTTFAHFNRYDFLKVDAAGEFYWNDEFLFETDPTSTIMMNREAMWQQIDLKYQAGAFGEIGQPETLLTYWTFMEKNDYPNSAAMKDIFLAKVQEQKQQEQMMLEQQVAQQQMAGMPMEGVM